MKPTLTSASSLALLLTVGAAGHVQGAAAFPSQAQVAGGAQPRPADVTTTAQQREKAAQILTAVASVPTTDTTDPARNALRANAMEGLIPLPGRLEPILKAAFTDRAIGIRSVAAMAMGKAKIKSLADAVQPLTRDQSPLVRAGAAFALQRVGEPADPNVLAGMLVSDSTQQRSLAAWILGELGNKSAIPMLMSAVAQPPAKGGGASDKLVRLQIAEALVKLGKRDALVEIRAALFPATPDDLEATALAVQIIGQVGDAESRPQLHNMIAEGFHTSNPLPLEVRMAAAASLAKLGETRAETFASAYLADQSPAIRAQAAAVLGEMRDAKHLPRLLPLLSDSDEQVRVTAAAATLKITDSPR